MAVEGSGFTPVSAGGSGGFTPLGGSSDSLGRWLGNAVTNAFWQMGPGLVGVKEPFELSRWQAENPTSSMVSSMLGLAVPYLGWARATSGVGALGRTVGGLMERVAPISGMASMPVRTAAAREIIRFAPFEAGRVALAPALGPAFEDTFGGDYQGVGDVARGAGTDLVLGGALGGIFGGLSAYGRKVIKRRGIRPGANLNSPLQQQLREINQVIARGAVDPEKMAVVEGAKNRIKNLIVEESAPEGRYFEDEELNNSLGQLFTPKAKTKFRVGKLTSKNLYRSRAILDTLESFPEDWQQFVKFPRIVQSRLTGDRVKNAKNEKAVKGMLSRLRNGNESVRWEYVKSENTFVVGKKLTDTDWIVFKTDSPGVFLPEEEAWKEAMEKTSAATFGKQLGELPQDTGSELWDYAQQLQKEIPFVDWRGLKTTKGAVAETAKELLAKSGFKPYEGTGEALRRAGLFVRRYMAPAQLQTTDNPIANRIRIVSKEVFERGDQLVQRAILGTPKKTPGSQRKSAFFGPRWENNGSIAARAREIAKSPEEWDGLIKTIQSERGWRYGVKQYGLTERGVQLLRLIEREDKRLSDSIIAAQRASGIPEEQLFRPKENHFMLSRTWKGSWRVPVYNTKGNLVYISGGNTKSEAEAIAEEVIRQAKARGDTLRAGTSISTSEAQDIEMLSKLVTEDVDFAKAMRIQQELVRPTTKAGKPGTFKQRSGVEGYQIEFDSEDFIRSLINHARRYRRYEAEITTKAMFKKDLERLQWDDPEAYITIMERLDKLYGNDGKISKAINNAFDTVLSGVLGKNSASRIVGQANKLLYRYALGFGNIGYAVATMGTFIQTAFPMMHLINTLALNAPERLAKYTTYHPVFSAKGARMLGVVDSLKIAKEAWSALGNPDSVLWKNLQRSAEEGVTDPRFIDEWVGQTAINKQRFKSIFESKEPFSRFLELIADTLPATMERGSRAHTFAMGHLFYRDIMGVTDPEVLFRLSKDFTEKTQYMYSAADRPQIFNGPLGSMFGLFKNWMAHYTGWMLAYAGEAVNHGNWKPFLWMMAGTGSVGGLGALPFIGLAEDVSKAFSGDGILMNLYEMQGSADTEGVNWADALYYGLPSLLGVSIQGTVSAPLADPGADIVRMFSFGMWDQGQKLARAIGPTIDAMEAEGLYFLRDQEARRALLNAFAPKTLVRIAQAWEGPNLRSMNTGNMQIKGLSPVERILWASSVNPTRIERHFEISRELWNDQNKMRERVGYYGQQLANMYEERNLHEVRRLMVRATAEGIPLDAIQRSAQSRMKRTNQGLIEAQFDEAVVRRMQLLGIL